MYFPVIAAHHRSLKFGSTEAYTPQIRDDGFEIVPTGSGFSLRDSQMYHGFQRVSEGLSRKTVMREGLFVIEKVQDIPTAQIPGVPYLALDSEQISGRTRMELQSRIVTNKLSNLPECLTQAGRGILLMGSSRDFYPDEIEAMKQFSNTLAPGQFVVLSKTSDYSKGRPDSRNAQCWVFRCSTLKSAKLRGPETMDDILNAIRYDLNS